MGLSLVMSSRPIECEVILLMTWGGQRGHAVGRNKTKVSGAVLTFDKSVVVRYRA